MPVTTAQWKPAPGEQFSELRTRAAQRVADLVSRYEDLSTVLASLQRLQSVMRDTTPDPVLATAYWATSAVYYGRCFKKGKLRTTPPAVASQLVEGHEELHNEILWRRDKEVSHAVESVFDDVLVAVGWIPVAPRGFVLNSIANRSLRNVGANDEFIVQTLAHVAVLMERLAGLINAAHRELEGEVTAMAERGQTFEADVTRFFLPEPGQPAPGPLGGSVTFHTGFAQVEARQRRR